MKTSEMTGMTELRRMRESRKMIEIRRMIETTSSIECSNLRRTGAMTSYEKLRDLNSATKTAAAIC